MTTDVIDQFTILHLVKVKGLASAESVAVSLGEPTEVITPLLDRSVADELVRYREGRVTGYTLTAAGRARLSDLRGASLNAGARASLDEAYEAFLGANHDFKQLTTDWQLREPGSDTAPLLQQLAALDDAAAAVTATAAAGTPRFHQYRTRFTAAFDRLRAGDETAFARPMSESYHDVWMELHEDLLSSLDRERTEADE